MQSKIDELLNEFQKKRGKIDLSLDRIIAFMEKLGSPQLKLPPVIHIAGTNGKGSTLAFLRAMIEAEGKTCHVYTSPHLMKFNERIVLRGKEISDDYLLEILSTVERLARGLELTFYEITTAAAFLAFSQIQADYLLLETGLGGRFDATNIIPNPLLTIITPISFDHMEFLGNNLVQIAGEKAGIMKEGVPCVVAPQKVEVLELFSRKANEKNAELIVAKPKNIENLALKGAHQMINAAVAATAAEKIGISYKGVQRGYQTAIWRGRLQKLTKGELPKYLLDNHELWLDGAHNEDGAKVLSEHFAATKKPLFLILGMMKRKNPADFLLE
jgi:dihydrofolate synthase/folylpolyglutamate synthase